MHILSNESDHQMITGTYGQGHLVLQCCRGQGMKDDGPCAKNRRLAIYAFSEKSRYIEHVLNGILVYPRVVWVVPDIKNGVHTCMPGSQA
jgi:hypothetical protein